MCWYIAKIVFQVICGEGNHAPQFEEQIRLIRAGSVQEAIHKALETGFREQYVFRNNQLDLVQWKFINVPELQKLDEEMDGMELYSHQEEPGNAFAYIARVHHQAASMGSRHIFELSI